LQPRHALTPDTKREYNAAIEQVNASASAVATTSAAATSDAVRLKDLQQLQAALRALSLCDDEGALHARVLLLARRLQLPICPPNN
jgi:hypothetical protein